MNYFMQTGNRIRANSPRKRRHVVTTLTEMGLNGDVVAAKLRMNKNTLRAKHALELQRGREARRAKKEAAAAAALSKEEREKIRVIEMALNSHWTTPEHGCLLYGGARTVAEALEWLGGFKRE
jgi:hypothetical protein